MLVLTKPAAFPRRAMPAPMLNDRGPQSAGKRYSPVRSFSPVAIGAMTHGASRRVDHLTSLRICGPTRLNGHEPTTPDRGTRRNILRKPPDVGQDAAHLVAFVG